MITVLLEQIIQLLKGWIESFNNHAEAVEESLTDLNNTASDIELNTDPIPEIRDNTGAIITPITQIKTNTDSIKTDATQIKTDTGIIKNNANSIATSAGSAAAFAEDCATNTLDIVDKVTTIASDTTQIRADQITLDNDLDKIYEAIKWSCINTIMTKTKSGASPISFSTDIVDELVDLKIYFNLSQSGSGDPSINNPRDFISVSSADLTVNGTPITISFGGSYYAGYIDYVNQKLVINRKIITIDGTNVYGEIGGTNMNIRPNGLIGAPVLDNTTYSLWKSNRYLITASGSTIGYNKTNDFMFIRQSSWQATGATDAATFNTYCASNNIQFTFPLETNVEIALTLAQLQTISGINTIASNTNGNIEVTYKESVKHYLDEHES